MGELGHHDQAVRVDGVNMLPTPFADSDAPVIANGSWCNPDVTFALSAARLIIIHRRCELADHAFACRRFAA